VIAYADRDRVHVTELDSGNTIVLGDASFSERLRLSWSPNGAHLLVYSEGDTTTIWLAPGAVRLSTELRRIGSAAMAEGHITARFSPASRWVWHHRAVRVSAGCIPGDQALTPPDCRNDPPPCSSTPRCGVDWVASIAHHVGSGRETRFGSQGSEMPYSSDDRFLAERVPSKTGAEGKLVIHLARGGVLEPIAKVNYAGQVRFEWQP
jgi:hypothetical protein